MKPTLGSFILIKNEITWIAPHLISWLPLLDEMVFFDGNSTDGTLEVLKDFKRKNRKIKIYTQKDPVDLKDDYVRLFDDALHSLSTDYAIFLHPDMFPVGSPALGDAIAYTCEMESFAADAPPPGPVKRFTSGRSDIWKNIYRINPDLGHHYHGHYGAANEDVYFSEITGDKHDHFGPRMDLYPYEVPKSGLKILHYSDVRPYRRRYERMVRALENQGYEKTQAMNLARVHPRVTLEDGGGFTFEEAAWPDVLHKRLV
jgi:glycosyltransferase involved in cell wall biosynthesis